MSLAVRNILAAAAAFTAIAGAAQATDYVTIPLEASVAATPDVVWKKVGGYCDIGAWMKTSCVVTSGGTEIGAVRRIADRIDEVLVAKTPWSYAYAQPKSPIDYHGSVEVRPDGKGKSKLIYTLVYDADALPNATPESKAADKERRTKTFTGVLATMKAIAEAK